MAERICLDLGDNARELLERDRSAGSGGGLGNFEKVELGVVDQLVSALENLGYATSQAERVAVSAAREAGEGASLESLIRVALKSLAP